MAKKILLERVWSKNNYYKIAGEGSTDIEHPAMKMLAKIAKGADQILDMGCGEGTRLNFVAKDEKGYGIDISSQAISMAKKKNPRLRFTVGDLEHLPYENESFDLVYSAFVFEHLDSPERVIKEGIRVLRKGGKFLIVAPNFGAPNRASPPSKGSRIKKLVNGFLSDFIPHSGLSWNRVSPIATESKYDIDWDTTTEPYLGSLIGFFRRNGLQVEYKNSLWSKELPSANLLQKVIRFLANLRIYPFNLWGPHLLIVGQKNY